MLELCGRRMAGPEQMFRGPAGVAPDRTVTVDQLPNWIDEDLRGRHK